MTACEDAKIGRSVLRTGENGGARLVCVPFSGATSRAYRPLVRALPPDWSVVAGSHRSAGINPDVRTLAEYYLETLASDLRGPVILFGHSMGAMVAYRMARILGGGQPGMLLVLSAPPTTFPGWHLLPDSGLVAVARSFGLVTPTVTDDVLTRFVLPPLRFDLTVASVDWQDPVPAGCPTYVLTGEGDDTTSPEGLRELATSLGALGVTIIPGEHMFVSTNPTDTARALVRIATPGPGQPPTRR